MNSSVESVATAMSLLRGLLFVLALAVALLATLAWAVRTRRVSPFSTVARFVRSNVDPLLLPIERRVIRAGGTPANAPWWALAAVAVGGIIVVSLLEFLVGQVMFASAALQAGPRGLIALLITWTIAVLRLALIARVISSWFNVSPYSRWMRWAFTLTEPMLAPLRRVIPTLGMIDLTPIIAYFLLGLVGDVLVRMA